MMIQQFVNATPTLMGVLLGGVISLASTIYVTNKSIKNNLLIANTQNRRDIYVKITNYISLFLTMDTRMVCSITYPNDPITGQEIEEEGEDTIRKMIRELGNHWRKIAGEAYLYLPLKSTKEIEEYIRFLDGISDEIRDSSIYNEKQLTRIQNMTKRLLVRLRNDIGVID